MIVTEAELVRWGRRIGRSASPPLFLGLTGSLGAGKSVLARAVAGGAGVTGAVPSPTFNLLFRYDGSPGVQVVHLDLYRLTAADELWELGWEELGGQEDIVLVEWPERAGDLLPDDRWEIRLSTEPEDPLLRRVEVERVGLPHPLPGFPVEVSGEPLP